MKIADLLAERANGEVQIGSSTVEFRFFVLWRDRFSDDEWAELLTLTGRDYLKMLLPRVLQSWELVDDDGHAIPVTAAAIDEHHIPDALLVAIERRALASDLSGKAPGASNSSPGT